MRRTDYSFVQITVRSYWLRIVGITIIGNNGIWCSIRTRRSSDRAAWRRSAIGIGNSVLNCAALGSTISFLLFPISHFPCSLLLLCLIFFSSFLTYYLIKLTLPRSYFTVDLSVNLIWNDQITLKSRSRSRLSLSSSFSPIDFPLQHIVLTLTRGMLFPRWISRTDRYKRIPTLWPRRWT